jgi:hypothetical protein
MMNSKPTPRRKQFFTLLLGVMLGLAIFVSPYQLHHSPGSIFFTKFPANTEPSSHDQHHEDTKDIRCLRCVLYGFQVPETIAPFVVILVVLGFLTVVKPAEPFSFITLDKSARAPPVHF